MDSVSLQKEKREYLSITAETSELTDTGRKKVNYEQIIFLPFNKGWSNFLMLTTLVNFSMNWIHFVFDFTTKNQTIVYYVFEFLYALNTLSLIAHKYMPKSRRSRIEKPMHPFLLFLNVLSLIPYYEIQFLLQQHTWDYYVPNDVYRIKVTLRLGMLIAFFREKKNSVEVDHVYIVTIIHIARLIVITTLLCCIWYKFACFKCTTPNWTDIIHVEIEMNNTLYWWAISYHITASIITHNWIGIIIGEVKKEWLFVLVCMMLGFVLHIMIFFGELTAAFIHQYKHQFDYTSHLKKILYLLDDWNVDQIIRKRTIEYYDNFWEKRRGMREMPEAITLVPMAMRKTVTLDIFWDALRHSHLLVDTSMPFKRSVSMLMKTEFMLPGDYIYRKETPKWKMYYIASGVVQVLSDEDNESAILSFSAGTLLGESSLLFPIVSNANVKCATYCEFHTLTPRALTQALMENGGTAKYLVSLLIKRVEKAKKLYTKTIRLRHDENNDISVKRVKAQWRTIYSLHASKLREIDDSLRAKLDKTFLSQFMDLIVLSEEVELKIQAICLTSKCPLIMEPKSSFRFFCNLIVLASAFLQFILVPWLVFFRYDINESQKAWLFRLDLVYIVDIYLQLTTAVYYESKIVSNFSDIFVHRMKDIFFIVDVLASIPYPEMLHWVKMNDWEIFGRVPRVLKIYKLFVLIREKEVNPWFENKFLKVVKYIMLNFVLIYLFSSTMYAISCFKNLCNPMGWFSTNAHPKSKKLEASIFHVASLFLDVGISDTVSYLLTDIALATLITYVGYFVYSFTFAELTASTVLNVRKAYAHQDEIYIMDNIMTTRSIDIDLRTRLMDILHFNWQMNDGAELHGTNGILKDISEKLKNDILTNRIVTCLKMVPLFQNVDERIIKYLGGHMKISVLPPGVHLLNTGFITMTVYVIIRGCCSMSSMLPGDRERGTEVYLQRGELLAPLEVLHRIKSFITIKTITAVEVMQMPYEIFRKIFKSVPGEDEPLQKALAEHIERYKNTLHKKSCRLPEMKSIKPALGKIDSFGYNIFRHRISEIDEYTRPFLAMRHWSWLRYVLLRTTIDPTQTFFITWEVFRMITIFLDVAVALSTATLFLPHVYLGDMFELTFCILAAIDVYIRLHCQYYNEYGALVTHPLWTTKHYFQCSFPIDVLQTVPLFLIKIDYLFGKSYIISVKTLLRILIRSLQLYKFFKAMSYIESKLQWSWGTMVIKLKYSVFLIVILFSIANVLMMTTCNFSLVEHGVYTINCTGFSWLNESPITYEHTIFKVFLQCFYLVVAIYANALCGTFSIGHYTELKTFTALLLGMTLLKCVILAGFTSCTTGGSINLSTYQTRMKQFLKFAKEVKMENHLIKETIDHNEMMWKITQGSNIMAICSKFNNFLRSQFTCFLYESTVRSTTLLESISEPFLQQVALLLEEMHFKKDADIIRCNDVQNYMYIVHKGTVSIYVANCEVATLEKGGLFGCFLPSGTERQTITVTTQEHTTVLTIKSKEFHRLLQIWGNEQAEEIMRVILSLRYEFVPSRICSIGVHQYERFLLKRLRGVWKYYYKYITKFNEKIKAENSFYWLWDYSLHVHLAFISSICALLNMCVYIKHPSIQIVRRVFIITDVIFTTRLIKGFSMVYTNNTTGNVEWHPKLILMKYLKSWFCFDLLMCLPIEEIMHLIRVQYTKLGGINRVFRLMIICTDRPCTYVTNIIGRPTHLKLAKDTLHSIAVAYTFVINIFTSTGLRAVSPVDVKELIVSLVMSFLVPYIISTLASGFATLLMLDYSSMMKFQQNMECMKFYLKGRDLSSAIFKIVWQYFEQLWKMERGEWMPAVVNEAPSYIKQDIMQSLYISHLKKHFLFANTHKDFLRQLVVHLERCIYLPGNYIVEQGDMDNAIYFIHKGEVGAYTVSDADEVQCYILNANMSFGESQGLHQIPYQLSYKAISTVEILALRKQSWDYLLQHFPATQETLRLKSAEYGLIMDVGYANLSSKDTIDAILIKND